MILRLAADGRILLSQKPRGFYRDLVRPWASWGARTGGLLI